MERQQGTWPARAAQVPGGWQQYVSALFTWALGRQVTEDEAKRCAKREPGRSWEALESEMALLGACIPIPRALPVVFFCVILRHFAFCCEGVLGRPTLL
jgi:hypothetical protein